MRIFLLSLMLVLLTSCEGNNSSPDDDTEAVVDADITERWYPDDWVTDHEFPDEKFEIDNVFPDPAFRKCVKKWRRVESWNDLLNIDEVSCSCGTDGKPIEELEGLQYLVNLYRLSFTYCSPTIERSYMKNLNRLRQFVFNTGTITSIDFIQDIGKIEFLVIRFTNLQDISQLSNNMTLNTVFLDYNYIKDPNPLLSIPNLKQLLISNNCIEDIAPLKQLLDNGVDGDYDYDNYLQQPEKCQ